MDRDQCHRVVGLDVYVFAGSMLSRHRSGRIRLAMTPDASGATLAAAMRANLAAGAIVHTDGWRGYRRLSRLGYHHRPRSQLAARASGEDIDQILPRVHRVIST